jgi:hypothetical protein
MRRFRGNEVPLTVTVAPGATRAGALRVGAAARVSTAIPRTIGKATMGIVARKSRKRCGVGFGVVSVGRIQRCPSQKAMSSAPFGNPAGSESPVALRPRLATGVLFRGPHLGCWRGGSVRVCAAPGRQGNPLIWPMQSAGCQTGRSRIRGGLRMGPVRWGPVRMSCSRRGRRASGQSASAEHLHWCRL